MKNQKNNALVVVLILAIVFGAYASTQMGITGNPTVVSACDSEPGWGGLDPWVHSINTADKKEGTGCLQIEVSQTWDTWWWPNTGQSEDWTNTPIVTFWIKVNTTQWLTRIHYVTNDAPSYWDEHVIDLTPILTAGTWVYIEKDLRVADSDVVLSLQMNMFSIEVRGNAAGTVQTGPMKVQTDDIKRWASDQGGPLTCTVSPSTLTLNKGQTQTFTATATGGVSPYSYKWVLDGTQVAGAGSSTYSLPATLTIGAHTLKCEATDSAPTTVSSPTITITILDTTTTTTVAHNLTVQASLHGSTTPAAGNYSYSQNDMVTILASPDSGYKLGNWVLDGQNKTGETLAVTMDSDHVVSAEFIELGGLPEEPQTSGFGASDQTMIALACISVAVVLLVWYSKRRKKRGG